MPTKLVYDIFPLRGVVPKWKPQVDAANKLLKASHPDITVTAEVGKFQWFWQRDGKGNMKSPAMGAMPPGKTAAKDYRYSQDQKDLMNHPMLEDKKLGPEPGHIPVVWAESFSTGELGETVNPAVWDSTYVGRSGLFMSNASAGNELTLLHETGHLAGLSHDDTNANELMNSWPGNTILKANKQALFDAVF
ncbi:MAG: hypothetical protein JXB05_21355 [Myxococcaceae bacterium]|nr:hypothetical protein [Myxococcaceae bacterium]